MGPPAVVGDGLRLMRSAAKLSRPVKLGSEIRSVGAAT